MNGRVEHMADTDWARINWRSHRGMLELDLLLLPFVKEVYSTLEPELQRQYADFLECPDPQLYAWLLGHEPCEDSKLKGIVEVISAFNGS